MSRPTTFTLSCVIPAYNEAPHLRAFIEHLYNTLHPHIAQLEIVIINDGSHDETDTIIRHCLNDFPLRYIQLSRNFGKEAALSAGLDFASGDAVVLIDSDFQHPVELVLEMLTLWQQGYDMIYGVISDRSNEVWLKRFGTRAFYKILNAKRANRFSIPADAGDFRLLDRAVVDTLKRLPERQRFMKGLYAWAGYKTVALPFTPAERASGHSSFNWRRLLSLASIGITSFSSIPLRLSAIIGGLISLCSIGYGVYVAIDTLIFGNTVPGWTTLAVGLMLFSGVQLIMLGIMGEYISQIYEEIKRRPLYVVTQTLASPRLPKGTQPPAADADTTTSVT